MRSFFDFEMRAQPDDSTCGPTCLHAIYGHFGDSVPLEDVIREVRPLDTFGTLAVLLARHALGRGYGATIHTYNLHVFDPSWFERGKGTAVTDLRMKMRAQAEVKADPKLRVATSAYLDFLDHGGRIRFAELTPSLLRSHLERDRPILTGLSATYLYGSARETGGRTLVYDDVRGEPTGHFVVLCGHDPSRDEVLVADPLQANPPYGARLYPVPMQRVLGAILLGILTYDANFLVIEPGRDP